MIAPNRPHGKCLEREKVTSVGEVFEFLPERMTRDREMGEPVTRDDGFPTGHGSQFVGVSPANTITLRGLSRVIKPLEIFPRRE
jgi:hypothetical protein